MNNYKTRVGIFIAISLLWSFLWFSQRGQLSDFFAQMPSMTVLFFGLVPTLGLFLSGLFLRNKLETDKISLTGGNAAFSGLILLIPIVCLAAIGVSNAYDIQANLFGLLMGVFVLIYAFLEEYGWRGYLQEELTGKMNKWAVYILIGIAWYLWHWFFLRTGNDPKLVMLPLLIAASAGIGEVSKATRSILVCAAFHGIANILILYPVIAKSLSSNQKLIILLVCLAVWIPLVKKMEKSNAQLNH